MKRLLANIMSMVFVLVAGVSCFNPNKETEAEYKARIKKSWTQSPLKQQGINWLIQRKTMLFTPKAKNLKKVLKWKLMDMYMSFIMGWDIVYITLLIKKRI